MITERLRLGPASRVIELGSNDGYLLQFFVERGIPVLGIDPAANVAKAAEQRGVPTFVKFFNVETARELAEAGTLADLVIGNNVLAQVANLNSFVEGIRVILKLRGVCTIEFPHLLKTMAGNQFDQIYHEHFSYFSALTAEKIFSAHGMRIFDVEELWTHGGSLRIYACHAGDTTHPSLPAVSELMLREREAGLDRLGDLCRFRRTCSRNQAQAAELSDRGKELRQIARRLRRARQGQYLAQLLRNPPRFSRLHGGP